MKRIERPIQKTAEANGVWLIIKLLIKLQKSQKLCKKKKKSETVTNEHNKEIPKKDIYLQKEDRNLLMIWDKYNNAIMEYQKIINFWDNTINQSTEFRTKTWVEINDDSRGTYNTGSKTKFKTSMLKSRLCDYSDIDR